MNVVKPDIPGAELNVACRPRYDIRRTSGKKQTRGATKSRHVLEDHQIDAGERFHYVAMDRIPPTVNTVNICILNVNYCRAINSIPRSEIVDGIHFHTIDV